MGILFISDHSEGDFVSVLVQEILLRGEASFSSCKGISPAQLNFMWTSSASGRLQAPVPIPLHSELKRNTIFCDTKGILYTLSINIHVGTRVLINKTAWILDENIVAAAT